MMASNAASTTTLSFQPLIPIFKGTNYHFWSLRMQTMFKSQELWDLVEKGFEDTNTDEPDQQLRENRKKDAKALFLIHQAIDDEIFSCIAAASTSTQAWEILKQEYLGNKKVIMVKLQTLRHDFETLAMKEKESMQEFFSRVSGIVNHMKIYGEKINNEIVVSKILRSLAPRFDHIVAAIEESKDLSIYAFDKLMSSLLAHEARICRFHEKVEEEAFQAKGESASQAKSDPIFYEDAAANQIWVDAMKVEMASIERNQTWELVDLPREKNVIGLKWVYHTKYYADGTIQKHKARLVAQGYSQQHCIDFGETFSPITHFETCLVAKGHSQQHSIDFGENFSPITHFETVRIFLALAAQFQWPVYQFDVKSAFLNGEIEEEVYVCQPEGFINDDGSKVYRLKKALYGLKQAPQAWYYKIDSYFRESGFERSKNEPTLYIKKRGKSDLLVVCLYVDDMIYMGSSKSLVEKFKTCMMKKFEMSDLGLLHYFLGLEINQSEDGIFISQQKYAIDLLKKFNMLNCNPAKTPMNVNEKLVIDDGTSMADATIYRRIVGRLNYLTQSRPDLVFSVSMISRFMHKPSKHHMGAAKRILRYVAGTKNFGIWYSKTSNFKLFGFTDSDWASDLNDRKSTSGYVFSLGSGAVAWSSKKQETIALSSSEAHYVAANASASQAIWIRRLLTDFQHEEVGATELFCDNKATIAMTKNLAFHSRIKHIDIHHHFIRDLVAEGIITLNHCETNEQVANVLTKSLPQAKFEYFRLQMGVTDFQARRSVNSASELLKLSLLV